VKAVTGRTSGWAGLVGRIVAAVMAVAVMAVGLMFSLVLFAVALVVGVCVFGWRGWKIRRALKLAQADPLATHQRASGQDGQVIEGEVIHSEWKDNNKPR
jgi:threonine/homoserine/homoserine lactone efflux protein